MHHSLHTNHDLRFDTERNPQAFTRPGASGYYFRNVSAERANAWLHRAGFPDIDVANTTPEGTKRLLIGQRHSPAPDETATLDLVLECKRTPDGGEGAIGYFLRPRYA